MNNVATQSFTLCNLQTTDLIPLPTFQKLKVNYPGYKHHQGALNNHHLIKMIGCESKLLLHDTSALRLSVALNKVGNQHSIGRQLIKLSKFGRDSVPGRDGFQYIYHPMAYGPYLADKYGYPSISKLHQMDPIDTKKNFWGKQGILRVITYTKKQNRPKGHVALWDCNHFHQSKDWIAGHSLITVEFWETPDSNCDHMPKSEPEDYMMQKLLPTLPPQYKKKFRHNSWKRLLLQKQRLSLKGK
ncbi:hypothetical protein LOTGIDRAFT_162089 [Lottia gigantea]|uniref:Uncharacterized protein n=1 Tax=Lottia gigantea TaxID=225164 RepID=V4AI30_LOTGI|nr:hypothetical protein LOTGIDRAFT_162089 [Lottia gigantea]ESO93066.1 hypothetical protein LOTGIDRAFT_162089 [Lottia gigantea]